MDWSLQTGAFVVSSSDKVELDFTDRSFRSVLFGVSYSDKVAIDFTDRSFRSVLFGQSCTRLYGQELSLCLIRTKLNSTLRTGSFVVSHTDKVALDFTDRIVRCVLSGQSCARLCQQDPSQYHPDKVAVDVTDRILRSVIRTRLYWTLLESQSH